jgi:type II secretory pathway component PulL
VKRRLLDKLSEIRKPLLDENKHFALQHRSTYENRAIRRAEPTQLHLAEQATDRFRHLRPSFRMPRKVIAHGCVGALGADARGVFVAKRKNRLVNFF